MMNGNINENNNQNMNSNMNGFDMNMNQGINNFNNNINDNMMDQNLMNQGMINQNMDESMSEQDLIIKQKIEKREKIDTILAYALLVILVGAIAALLIVKFTRKEDTPVIDEYVPNYISLSEIANSLNTSTLATRYLTEGATFNSTVSGESLVVTYINGDTNLNLNMPMGGNELEVTMPLQYTEVITDIYKEVANIVCVYYDNEENNCRTALANVNSGNPIEGIRYVTGEDTETIYINIIESIDPEAIYNEVTKVSINDTNYVLNFSDYNISNIDVVTSDINIIISGTVERTTDDTSNFSVLVKVYDSGNNLLEEQRYEYNENNTLESNNIFETTFALSSTLMISDIVNYSIEIEK